MGSELADATVTVTAAAVLSTLPSFTMSDATKVPATSALNVGLALVVEESVAVLPVGLVINTHLKVMKSLLASELAVPSKVTVALSAAF